MAGRKNKRVKFDASVLSVGDFVEANELAKEHYTNTIAGNGYGVVIKIDPGTSYDVQVDWRNRKGESITEWVNSAYFNKIKPSRVKAIEKTFFKIQKKTLVAKEEEKTSVTKGGAVLRESDRKPIIREARVKAKKDIGAGFGWTLVGASSFGLLVLYINASPSAFYGVAEVAGLLLGHLVAIAGYGGLAFLGIAGIVNAVINFCKEDDEL